MKTAIAWMLLVLLVGFGFFGPAARACVTDGKTVKCPAEPTKSVDEWTQEKNVGKKKDPGPKK